jgi:DNA-binding transcriptional ArsR family regulator
LIITKERKKNMNRKKIIDMGILCGLSLSGSATIHVEASAQHSALAETVLRQIDPALAETVRRQIDSALAKTVLLQIDPALVEAVLLQIDSALVEAVLLQIDGAAGPNPTDETAVGAAVWVIFNAISAHNGDGSPKKQPNREELAQEGRKFLCALEVAFEQFGRLLPGEVK